MHPQPFVPVVQHRRHLRNVLGAPSLAIASSLLRFSHAPAAEVAAASVHALPAAASAAATRESARSSAAAAAFLVPCALSSGVLPYCNRGGTGHGASKWASEQALRDPHPILYKRVHPRGREEESDDSGVAIHSRFV